MVWGICLEAIKNVDSTIATFTGKEKTWSKSNPLQRRKSQTDCVERLERWKWYPPREWFWLYESKRLRAFVRLRCIHGPPLQFHHRFDKLETLQSIGVSNIHHLFQCIPKFLSGSWIRRNARFFFLFSIFNFLIGFVKKSN